MPKKIVVLIVLFILILVVGGFFWWENYRETPVEKWDEAEVSRRADYNIKETLEGKFIENEKAGISFLTPKEWILEDDPSYFSRISFHSPDAKFDEKRSYILEKGCVIDVYINYIKTNLDTLEKFINEDFSKSSSVIKINESSKTKISNYTALKYEYDAENLKMSYISVNLPIRNKVYKISLSNHIQEKESCEQEFDKFLETVSIKPN